MTASSTRQLTTLLPNQVLARLEQLRIGSARRFTNKSRGEHLAGKGGGSTDFSDYRDYSAGDDLRFVDWNIFSRLHRPYVKLYEQEEEMHVLLLVDGSASMDFEGKFDLARSLAAAFGVMGLLGRERVSAYACGGQTLGPRRLAPCTGRASFPKLFRFLEDLAPEGGMPVDDGILSALREHAGRGVAVVVSDFLTFGNVHSSLSRLFGAGLEIFAIQILSATEADPELGSDARLVDCETAQTLDVTGARDILEVYHQYREAYTRDLAAACRQRGGRFLQVRSDESVSDVLLGRLLRRGWVG